MVAQATRFLIVHFNKFKIKHVNNVLALCKSKPRLVHKMLAFKFVVVAAKLQSLSTLLHI